MDNFKKFASDASQMLNRVVQLAGEASGQSERTAYGEEYQKLAAAVDINLTCTESLIYSFLRSPLNRSADEPLEVETLGTNMTACAAAVGADSGYGKTLNELGKAEVQLGKIQREFMKASNENVVTPLTKFLNGDMNNIYKERLALEGKRLDLDASKGRLKKAQTNASQAEALKKAEAETAKVQEGFDKQLETTKKMMSEITPDQCHRCLKAFLTSQLKFHADSAKILSEAQGKV